MSRLFRPFLFRTDKPPEKKAPKTAAQPDASQPDLPEVSSSIQENKAHFERLFQDNETMLCRKIRNQNNPSLYFYLFYSDGMADMSELNESVILPLNRFSEKLGADPIQTLTEKILPIGSLQVSQSWDEIIKAVTYGDAILFLPGCNRAVILEAKCFYLRAVQEPDSEKILTGPREGFNEDLNTNLTLLRRKLRTNDLKIKYRTFGRRTQTRACLCYMDSIVNKNVLKQLQERLDKIDIDGVFDTNYLTELIRDASLSAFRTTGYTERPDVTAAKLLEGRIAIFLDGTPVVLTVPYLFIENFQSSEDYYLNFFYTSFSRILRILSFFLTITIPGFYIAIVAFHHEMLPTPLLLYIASERQGVPLPAAAEAFLMLLVFDILRETGIRMPSNIGQALSIVGALVIGQAAVEAKLVAAPMIIIVGMTGITGLLVPKLNAPIIFTRAFILCAATIMGLFGMALAFCALAIHLLNLDSFGVSQLTPSGKLQFQDLKDKPMRAPMWDMITRPKTLTRNVMRMNPHHKMKKE